MNRKDGFIVGLLGIIAGLLIVVTFQLSTAPGAQGQTQSSSGNIIMGTSVSTNNAVCFLYDTSQSRLAVYAMSGTSVKLMAVRTTTTDFSVRYYGRTTPTEKELKKAMSKGS